jgi:hypothetical protein
VGRKKRLEILQMALLQPVDGHFGRNRFRVGHRRIADRGRRDQPAGVARPGHFDDHPLPAVVGLRQTSICSRPVRGIVRSGGADLALELESKGYEWITGPMALGAS